jgi:hypothetical protein
MEEVDKYIINQWNYSFPGATSSYFIKSNSSPNDWYTIIYELWQSLDCYSKQDSYNSFWETH